MSPTRSLVSSSLSLSISHSLFHRAALCLPASIRSCAYHCPRMASTLPKLPLFEALQRHDARSTAVVHSQSQRKFTYGQLIADVAKAKKRLGEDAKGDLNGERVAFLVENSYDYVVTLLSIFASHGIALPLSAAFPPNELQYILEQSEASMLLASEKFQDKAKEVLEGDLKTEPRYVKLEKAVEREDHEKVELEGSVEGKGGMMLYTSGTTSRPKGVLLPQSVLTAQCQSLNTAWEYSPKDRVLHVLPLHHIHGTVNAILAPLFAGSSIEFLFPFNATAVWTRFGAPFVSSPKISDEITIFTAVPTVYNRLLSTHSDLSDEQQTAAKKAITPEHLRLNMCGSASLPTPTKKKWSELSGSNVLLERYGMTEVGMALSCGLAYSSRVDGSVGFPLPTVEVRLVDTDSKEVIQEGEEKDASGKERDGEIQLRGPTVFKEYWRNPEATAKEHVEGDDGKGKWFKTGDVAVRGTVSPTGEEAQDWATGPMYFIRGRLSADIIKSGGEKVSALEVEREILALAEIEEVAVVAVPSGKWGQKVGAVLVLKEGTQGQKGEYKAMDLRRALKGRMAGYKIPQVVKVVEDIKRNAMGKINKKELVKAVFKDDASGDEAGSL